MTRQVPVLANGPKPLAPYSVVTEANGLVFISGQVAIDPNGGSTPTNTSDQTKLIMENISQILSELGLGLHDLVKTSIFLVDMADFEVVNEVYGSFFSEAPPARTTVQVVALPRPQFKVEIEAIATR